MGSRGGLTEGLLEELTTWVASGIGMRVAHAEPNAAVDEIVFGFENDNAMMGMTGPHAKGCPFGIRSDVLIKHSGIIIGFVALSFVTVFGNLLIIAAILTEPRLKQSIANHYYISLAVADTMVGLLSMPAMLVATLHGCWPLGAILCDMWTSVDSLACVASFLGLCFIAYDRYSAVNDPFKHMRVQSVQRVQKHCLIIWAVSCVAWIPAAFTMGSTHGGSDPIACEFKPKPLFTLAVTVFIFYVPIVFMVTFYVKLYSIIRKTLRGTVQVKEKSAGVDIGKEVTTGYDTSVTQITEVSTVDGSSGGHKEKQRNKASNPVRSEEERKSRAKKEQRAARTLGLVMVVFIISWSGWCITWPISVFFPGIFPSWMFELSCWMACGNSAVNPFLYVFSSRDFRIGCMRVLRRMVGKK